MNTKRRKNTHYSDNVLRIVLISVGALLAMHLFGQVMSRIVAPDNILVDELSWRFNVDLEMTVPTWFSSFLAGAVAIVAFFVAGQYRRLGANKATIITWLLIAFVMMAISIDEAAAFHELALQALHVYAELGDSQSYAFNAWRLVIPAIVVTLAVGLSVIYKQLPRRTFYNLAFAVGVYVLGAVVVEYLSIPFDDGSTFYNFVLSPVEEVLEMLGLWLLLRSVIVHIRTEMPGINKKLEVLWQTSKK